MITKESVILAAQNQISGLIRKKAKQHGQPESETYLVIEKKSGLQMKILYKTKVIETLSEEMAVKEFDIPLFLRLMHVEKQVIKTLSNLIDLKKANYLLFSLRDSLAFVDKYEKITIDEFEKAFNQ